jgi:hypothetical protein
MKVIYEVYIDSDKSNPAGTPDAYRVYESPKSSSGIVVFGLYPGKGWKAHPNTHALVKHLVEQLP